MAEDVVIQMSAQDAEMVAAWQRARSSVEQYEQQIRKLQGQVEKAGQRGRQEFDSLGQTVARNAMQFVGMATPLMAIHTVTRLIRQEWDLILERQKTAAGKQTDVNASWRNAVLQLQGRKTSITPDTLFESMVTGANGVPPAEMFQTFAEVAGAAGDIPVEQVRDTILESSRLYPGWNLQTRAAAVRASVLAGRAFKEGPKEAFAGIVQAMTADPSKTPEQFAEFVVPSIISLRQIGSDKDTFEDLAALQFAFNQRAGDVGGRSGGTNLINLMRQIHRDAVGAGLVPRDASIMQMVQAAKDSPALQSKLLGSFAKESLGVDERTVLREMEADLKNRRELSIRARFYVAAREVLSPATADNELEQMRRGIRPQIMGMTPEAIAEAERLDKILRSSRFAAAAETTRASTQEESEFFLLSTRLGAKGAAAETLDKSLKRMGVGAIGRTTIGAQFQLESAMAGDETEQEIVDRMERMRRQTAEFIMKGARTGLPSAVSRSSVEAAEQILLSEKMDRVIELLEEANAKPKNVVLEGDNRPNVVHHRAPIGVLND